MAKEDRENKNTSVIITRTGHGKKEQRRTVVVLGCRGGIHRN